MKTKALVFCVAVLLASCLLTTVAAQSSTQNPLVVSPNGIVMVGKESSKSVTENLSFVGIASQTNVNLFTSNLFDNSTGKTIPSSKIILSQDKFGVSANQQEIVNITINSDGFVIGNYQGTILAVANPVNANTTITNIGITVRIEPIKSAFGSSYQTWLIAAIIILSFAGYFYGEKGPKYNTQVIILFAAAITSIWIYTVINYTFSDLNTVISTILIAPFLTYTASFLNEKRIEKNSKDTASLNILKEGTKDDIDLIRNIMGELVTHYASFDPYRYTEENYEEKNEPAKPKSGLTRLREAGSKFFNRKVGKVIDENANSPQLPVSSEDTKIIFSPQILFNKSGLLSRDVWDKSCKQGRVADLPILRLQKYYDFIMLYNRYYNLAITKTAGETKETFKDISEQPFFKNFKAFRKAYADLENVLFANLSYDIGLFTTINLSPINPEYPRITIPLIEKLIDYNVLKIKENPISFFKKQTNNVEEIRLEYNQLHPHHTISSDAVISYFNKRDESKITVEQLKGSPALPKDKNLEKFEEFLNEQKKDRVKNLKKGAKTLEKISKDIYQRNNITTFYYEVENDFQKKYAHLLNCMEVLLSGDPLAPELVDSKKAEMLSKEHSILKKLFDGFDKLKKDFDKTS